MNFYCLLIFLIIAIPSSIYDIKKFRIPLFLVLAGILFFILYYLIFFKFKFVYFLQQTLWGVIGTVIVLLLARILTGGGLGWGDVIFGVFCSLFIGFPLFCFIYLGFSSISGILFYVIFSFTRKKAKDNKVIIHHNFVIPYIPFMTAGTLITYFLLWINWLNF